MVTLKPRTLGVVTKVLAGSGGRSFSVAALGFFDLLDPAAWLPDSAMWGFAAANLPRGTPLDLGLPKVRGEVLVYGSAVPAGGEAATATVVEVAVAGIRKQATVRGDRAWALTALGLRTTEPRPFTAMPLDWSHAFGGVGFGANPVGKGFDAERLVRAGRLAELPNVEAPGQPVATAADRPEPWGFGALDPSWSARAGKLGRSGSRFTLEGGDPTVSNAAPPDQWLPGWFAGDEAFGVSGMHADHPRLRGTLPGLRARCFVQQADAPLAELRLRLETVVLFPTALRGVVIFRGTLPVAGVEAEDVHAVLYAYERMGDPLRPHEHYAAAFRRRMEGEDKALHALSDRDLVPEVTAEAATARHAARAGHEAAELEARRARMARATHAALGAMGARLRPGFEMPEPKPLGLPVLLPGESARGEADIAGLALASRHGLAGERARHEAAGARARSRLAELENQPPPAGDGTAAMRSERDATLAKAEAQAAKLGPHVHGKVRGAIGRALRDDPPASGSDRDPTEELRAAGDRLRRTAATLRPSDQRAAAHAATTIDRALVQPPPAGAGAPEPGVAAVHAAVARAGPAMPAAARQQAQAKLAALPEQPHPAEPGQSPVIWDSRPAKPPPGPDALDAAKHARAAAFGKQRLHSPKALAPVAPLSPAAVERCRAAAAGREGLAGYDFAGADLRGLSLAGLDLAGAMFERADLAGVDFSGSRLAGAVFTEARLETASFEGADLTEANLCEAAAGGARFDGALLARAKLVDATLEEAVLDGAAFEANILMGAKLARASARQTRWLQCVFNRTDLAGADFSGADLERCVFTRCTMPGMIAVGARLFRTGITACEADGIDLSRATIARLSASRSAMTGMVAREVAGWRAVWTRSKLDGADLTRADLREAFIGDCTAQGASLYRADLTRAFLSGTDFTDTDFAEANLTEATLRRAVLDWAELRHACLHGIRAEGTSWRMADLTGANLRKTPFAAR